MEEQRIEKIVAGAVNITKVLIIIYLGFVEVFKIGKLLKEKLNTELDISKKCHIGVDDYANSRRNVERN